VGAVGGYLAGVTVMARTRTATIRLEGDGTLLEMCRRTGVPLGQACAGRVACARCLVTVESGDQGLEPPGEEERRVLARVGGAPTTRLACGCRVADPEVEVVVSAGYW
jgi:adenylate cyclase